MSIRVCVAGATGWTGSCVADAVYKDPAFSLSGAVAPSKAGEMLGSLIGNPDIDLKISSSVEDALKSTTDVLIDFTNPEVVKDNALTAIKKNVHVVIGTSGLNDNDYNTIDSAAHDNGVGVLAAGNFAITAVLMSRFAEIAAKYVPSWEIIDYASAKKTDAPSGTVRELVHRLKPYGPTDKTVSVQDTAGEKKTRGADLDGMQVHSLRLPGYIIGVDVIFGAQDEKLIIRHEAGSGAGPYVAGALMAAKRVSTFTGLKRGLDSILDF